MAIVLIRIHVAYPNQTIERLKQYAQELQEAGMEEASTMAIVDRPNIFYFMLKWESASSASSYWFSNAGASVLENMQSVDEVELSILEDPVTHMNNIKSE